MNTVISSDEYVAIGGCRCPFCKNNNIGSSTPQMDDFGITVPVECFACGETWTDVYGLIGYKE